MKQSNAPTLQDVAREAGVSAMTVSASLNAGRSSTRVSAATRIRVQEAALRLRYRTNAVARGLSQRRMDTIGVIAGIETGDINLYLLEILNGIIGGAGKYGQNITVFSVADWKQEEQRILKFCDGRVDGMILIATPELTAAFAETLNQQTPFVTIHGNCRVPFTINLDIDNEGGAYEIVSYLVAQGHRRIAHFTGNPELIGAQQRLDGYRRALAEAGIVFDEKLVFSGCYTALSGRERTTHLLDCRSLKPLPTAVFCASDEIALGCVEVLSNRGFRVPEDISVAGFDDVLTARMTQPALTTVRQPFREMGERAVECVLAQIALKSDGGLSAAHMIAKLAEPASFAGSTRSEVFPVELVVRGSVGPPPEQPLRLPSGGRADRRSTALNHLTQNPRYRRPLIRKAVSDLREER